MDLKTVSSSKLITSTWYNVKHWMVKVLFYSPLNNSHNIITLDLKLHLQSTDYGQFLANEPSPLAVSTIDDRLREKLVIEFQHMRNHAVEPLATFLDYIT